MENKLPLDQLITAAIAYTENGGAPTTPKAGKTGELKSIFQFEPATWKAYAQQILGTPDAPMNEDAETYVVDKKVQNWLKQGLSPEQIFSSWNAGPGEPDAYTGKFSDGQPSKGINQKYGVAYDVPGYVDKAMGYLNKFMSKPSDKTDASTPAVAPQPAQNQQPPQSPQPIVNLPQPAQQQPGLVSLAPGQTKYA